MSALWAPITGGRSTSEAASDAEAAPKLRPVPSPAPRMARTPFVLVLIGIFGLGMAGLLMLNTTLQNQTFEARKVSRQATELAYTQDALEREVADLRAPTDLATRASKLGMRPNPHPAFLVLPEGKIVGKPKKVTGNEVPSLVVKTPEQLAAEKKEAAAKKKEEAAQKKKEAAEKKEAAAKKKEAAEKKEAAKKKEAAAKKKEAAEKKKDGADSAKKKDAAAKKKDAKNQKKTDAEKRRERQQSEGRG